MTDTCSGLHDPYEDQLAAARYRAERDALAQRMEEVASEIDRTLLGVEGIEDAPAMRWARGLREALGSLHSPRTSYEDIEAAAWVREHGGLDAVKRRWECLSYYVDPVPRACMEKRLARLQRQIDESHAALRRRNQRIEELEHERGDLYEMMRRLNAQTDEMEARLMPEGYEWPTVDGKPVDFVTGYEPSLGVLEAVSIYSNGACQVMSHDGIIKSAKEIHVAAPKVLDADGVPIKEGEVLWDIDTGTHGEVVYAHDYDGMSVKFAGVWHYPERCAHSAPVLADDGEPLEVGQTVWRDDGEMLEVLYLRPDGLVDCCGEIERPERLTHHRPVLDAEGNRIEPAMDVWWICEGDERGVHAERLHVESIGEDGLVTCDPYNGGTWVELDSSELHVKKPVLDADGVPIKVGDTVWMTGEPDYGPFTVTNITTKHAWHVYGTSEKDGDLDMPPSELTHTKPEPPDSWERWREEWQWPPVKYCKLILGVEYDHDTQLQESFDAQGEDLVRRARALAERERGE